MNMIMIELQYVYMCVILKYHPILHQNAASLHYISKENKRQVSKASKRVK